MSGPKETVYDESISPLMTEIVGLCQKHGINMAATFVLDYCEDTEAPLLCTTVLEPDDGKDAGLDHIRKVRAAMVPPPAFTMAITVERAP
jgi:hypothetical protein